MQRTYEIMFIVRPDILDEDLDKLIAGLEAVPRQRAVAGREPAA